MMSASEIVCMRLSVRERIARVNALILACNLMIRGGLVLHFLCTHIVEAALLAVWNISSIKPVRERVMALCSCRAVDNREGPYGSR